MIENNKILENVKLKISISNFANDEKILYSSLKKEKISFKNCISCMLYFCNDYRDNFRKRDTKFYDRYKK